MNTPTVYVICGNNCKYEGMTKEQILTAITQAVESGEITDVDKGFITTVLTVNNVSLKFFYGEQAAYNALTEEQKENLYAIITNDTFKDDVNKALEELKIALGYLEDRLNECPLVALYTLEPDCYIGSIKNGYTNSLGVKYFNRTPKTGDHFHCFGKTKKDNISFHMTAEVTEFVPDGNGGINAAFKAIEVIIVDTVKNAAKATNANNDGEGNNIINTYVNRNYMLHTVKNPTIANTSFTRKYNGDTKQRILWYHPEGRDANDALGISGVFRVTDYYNGGEIDIHFEALFAEDTEYKDEAIGIVARSRIVEKGMPWIYTPATTGQNPTRFHFLVVEITTSFIYFELYMQVDSDNNNYASYEIHSIPQINVLYK